MNKVMTGMMKITKKMTEIIDILTNNWITEYWIDWYKKWNDININWMTEIMTRMIGKWLICPG